MFQNSLLMAAASTIAAPATAVFTESSTNAVSGNTSYTFTSQDFGTAAANRKMIVAVNLATNTGASGAITGMTIGGVTASLIKFQANTVQGGYSSEMWQADVPTGTSGTVAFTLGAAGYRLGIGIYACYGAADDADDTSGDGTNDPMTTTIDCPANGFVIAAAQFNTASGVTAWTGVDEDYYDAITEQNSAGASKDYSTEQSDLTITCDPNASTSRKAMSVCSFGPA